MLAQQEDELTATRPDVNIVGMFAAVRARWLWILLPTLIAFVAAAFFVNMLTPRYTAETRLFLESGDSFYTRPAADQGGGGPLFDAEAVASQIQIITSRDLAREAVRKLNLVGNPEFDPLVAGVGPLERFMILLGVSRSKSDHAPEDRVLNAFFERLTVYAAGRSRVVAIEFQSRDPDLAARAANTVAELYLDQQEVAKKSVARAASVWLSSAIEPLRQRVAEAEGKVEEFRARAGLFATGTTTITTQQMSDLSTQVATARAQQADSQAKAKLIRELIANGRTIEIPDVANNEFIRRLTEQRAALRSQLALESRALLSDHPRIKELNAQLADLDREIRVSAERTVRTLEAEADIAGARVDSLTAALEAQKRQVAAASESEVQLRALERDARTQREQLETYLARFREATARDAENATPADGRIVSRAVSPLQPSFPKKVPIIVLATLGTFVLSFGTVLAGQLLAPASRSMRSVGTEPAAAERTVTARPEPLLALDMPEPEPATASVERPVILMEPSVPIAGQIAQAVGEPAEDPAQDVDREPVVPAPAQKPAAAETGRPDDTQLPLPLRLPTVEGRGRRVLAVTEGRWDADMAMRLVRELGCARTVVINLTENETIADGRRQTPWGFTDLVAGDAGFAEVIAGGQDEGLHCITLGTGPVEELADDIEAVEVALTAFEQTYDLVLVALSAGDLDNVADVFIERVDNALVAKDAPPALLRRLETIAPSGVVSLMPATAPAKAAKETELAPA